MGGVLGLLSTLYLTITGDSLLDVCLILHSIMSTPMPRRTHHNAFQKNVSEITEHFERELDEAYHIMDTLSPLKRRKREERDEGKRENWRVPETEQQASTSASDEENSALYDRIIKVLPNCMSLTLSGSLVLFSACSFHYTLLYPFIYQ